MCKLILIVLLNGAPLKQNDYIMLTQAQKTCKVRYRGCLKEFRIRPNNHYNAICKKEN